MERRYFVYNPAESKPKVIHNTYESAMQEAERIANKFDEGTIYILEIVGQIDKTLLVKETKTNRDGQEEVKTYGRIPF